VKLAVSRDQTRGNFLLQFWMRTHLGLLHAKATMKAKTEELLYLLLWTCDMFMRPTFRNLTDSFESWAYRNGLHAQLRRLEHQKFIEANDAPRRDRAYRLSEAGLRHVLRGRHPEARWGRAWDGRWRMVLFDFPNEKHIARNRLRAYLRARGFGYLQKSVWITPDPMPAERDLLAGGVTNVESLILLEARPCAGESDAEIVAGAWDFPFINARYNEYLQVLAGRPASKLNDDASAKKFRRWLQRERAAWEEAVSVDPLLPEQLLPASYRGRAAWQARGKAILLAAAQMKQFRP
jgi:phenylacetic acid degradation operon negative regulatory protein